MPTWTSRFTDTFTEAVSDTLLTAHTPDTGSAWSVVGTETATGAKAKQSDGTLIQEYYSGTGKNWYAAGWGTAYNANVQRAELQNTGKADGAAGRGAMVNLQTGPNGYIASTDGGVNSLKSFRVDAGSFTQLESTGTGSSGLVGVSNESGTIWIWLAGVHQGTGTADGTYTGGSCGLMTRKTFASAGGDNYEAFDEAAAAQTLVPVSFPDSVTEPDFWVSYGPQK